MRETLKTVFSICISIGTGAVFALFIVTTALPPSAATRQGFFEEGRRAGVAGLPPEACPYYEGGECAYEEWKKGWAEGKLSTGEKK